MVNEPDWSKVDAVGYRVTVSPGSYQIACWEFICLVPVGSEEPENIVLVRQLCEAVLEIKDKYSIYRMTSGDSEEYKVGMPVLAFDPEDEERWLWVFPPPHQRH